MTANAFVELDHGYAASVAQKAIRCMAEQRVAATPGNFNVWFIYSMGAPERPAARHRHPDRQQAHFRSVINRDLFSTYVASADGSAASIASQQLHAVVGAAQVFLATAIADNHSQMRAINDVAGQTEAGADPKLLFVLPAADITTAATIAERTRRAIAECHITRRSTGENLPTITVSIGAGQFRPGETMGELVERCDRALYLAKSSGRTRVVTESGVDRELAAS